MNNSARREFADEEGVELPEEQVDDSEKVTGPDHPGVVLVEGWPILIMGGVGGVPDERTPGLWFWHPDAEDHEFTSDALHAPGAVLLDHLLDQGSGFRGGRGAAASVAGPEPAK